MQITYSTTVPAPIELPAWLPTFDKQHARMRFESDQARMLIEYNGLDQIESLFGLMEQTVHDHKGRAVSRVVLQNLEGPAIEAFVKMNWGYRRLVPRFTDLRTGQALLSHPEREWAGIEALRSIGLFVPERIALIQRGRFWFQEAIVLKRVHPDQSLDEVIRNGTWDRYSEDDRQLVLEAVIQVMERIHHAGLGWRGTCTRHFFPNLIGGGLCQLWLIDCEGVHRHVTTRDIARNFRKLHRAFEISGANAATLRQFQLLAEKSQATHAPGPIRRVRLILSSHLKSSLKTSA